MSVKLKKIALISMCEGVATPGLRALEALAKEHGQLVSLADIRIGDKLPDLNDFDLLLSSGGPGDPRELGNWGQPYIDLIESIRVHNENHPTQPKRAFLVCHSFQMMSQAWGLGSLSKRDSALWGIHPQYPEPITTSIAPVFPYEIFHTLESRFYQVMRMHDLEQICAERKIAITARDDKGALTAWQTIDGHIAATQFHPEAVAATIAAILDQPPAGANETINAADHAMRDLTRERLHLLDETHRILDNFLTRAI